MIKRKKFIIAFSLVFMLMCSTGGVLSKNIYAYSRGESVYIGGMPIGITLNLQGLMVVGMSDVVTSQGSCRPSMDCDIKCGDIIVEVGNKRITSFQDFEDIMTEKCQQMILKLKRGQDTLITTIMPTFDIKEKKYKVGLWLKNSTAGIGTVTYMRENGEFAALGHPIINSATNEVVAPIGGKIYNCKVIGVNRSVPKKAGELKGMILKSQGVIGEVIDNNKFGLYGKLSKIIENNTCCQPLVACGRGVAKVGAAQILTTLNDGSPKYYDIAVIKTANQKKPDDKGLVIKITDKELLDVAGGIVQGMSGSPIIQNGKLIGAVTHVFINDPTRGYGMYIDWML